MSRFAIMLVAALMWAPLLHAAPKDDALAASDYSSRIEAYHAS